MGSSQKKSNISMSVVRRLPRYYRFLYDLKENDIHRISSRELAEIMGLTASQIRQDLNCFGGFGQQGYGYIVEELYIEIGKILGMDKLMPTVVIGAGNMGKAICNRIDFKNRGFDFVGIFDEAEELFGKVIAGREVLPIEKLEEVCRLHEVEMAIICIPKESVQEIVERILPLGVKNYWNFSHFDIKLNYPETTAENVHLGDSLMTLSYQIKDIGEN